MLTWAIETDFILHAPFNANRPAQTVIRVRAGPVVLTWIKVPVILAT